MKKIRALLTALIVTTLPAHAQTTGPWSLERCIDHALGHNLRVRQSALAVETGAIEHRQAKLNYLPTLGASANYNASFGRSLDPTTYEYVSGKTVNNVNGSLNLGMPVFAGMQRMHALKRSEFNLMSSVQEVERIKNEITIAVAAAYLQVLYAKEQVRTSESNIESIKAQLDRTAKMVEAGGLALGSRLEIESQLSAEEYNLVSYRNLLDNNLLTLSQLLELRDQPGFDVVEPDLAGQEAAAPPLGVDEVYALALGLPRIEVARLGTEIARRDVSLARAAYYPTVSLSASYGSSFSDARQKPVRNPDGSTTYTSYSFFDQMSDNASSGIGLNMSVPLFNRLSVRNAVRRAKIQLQSSELSLDQAENTLYKEIQQAWTDAVGALNRFYAAQSSVRSNEESFRYAEQKFNVNATTAVDYNTAKNNLINAQSMLIQAKYEYIFKMKILDFYQGKAITL